MSSPKREAKIVAKAIVAKTIVAKAAARSVTKMRPAAARPQAKPRPVAAGPQAKPASAGAVSGASADAKRLAAELERGIVDGRLDVVSTDALQALIAAACRVYTARTEAGEQITPVTRNSISATDVMVTASGLLRAADLAVFELGMWQSWTGR
jgi:hypothetical protein